MRGRLMRLLRLGLMALAFAFFMLPLLWLLTTAFKHGRDAFALPPQWLLFDWTLQNFRDVLARTDTLRFTLNSLIVSTGVVLLSLLLGVPAGYGLARSHSRLAHFSAGYLLLLLMIPPIAMLLPFYLLMRELHLLGTYVALILLDTIFDAAFVAWLMRAHFLETPAALEEAARLDGATSRQVFFRVALPLAIPGVVASALYCFIFSWNDFLFALMMTSPRTKTLPLGILSSFSSVAINWGEMAAMSLFAVIPVLVIALFLNRYFVTGATMGASRE